MYKFLVFLILALSFNLNVLAEGVKETEPKDASKPVISEKEEKSEDGAIVRRQFHSNGKTWYERRFVKDVQDGLSKEYFDNGNLKMEANFKKNKISGEVKHYYASGNLKAVIEHKNNVPNGRAKIYHETGELFGDYHYKDGKFDGLCKEFYKNGKIKYEHQYKKGVITQTKKFNIKGELKQTIKDPGKGEK